MYDIDFRKIIIWLLPTFLRKPTEIAWLNSLLSQVNYLYNQFKVWKLKQEFNLQINGQVIYLELVLREWYQTPGITITDGNRRSKIYIYPKLDDKPIWLGTKYIQTASFYNDEYVSFYVNVPASLYDSLNDDELKQMFALVDKYKVAGRTFKIRRV